MILAYRYIPYVHLTTKTPQLPLVTFADTINIKDLSKTSMNVIEPLWNKNLCITIALDHEEMEVYYFLLPDNVYYPNTPRYRRLQLEIMEAPLDEHCDYYAKAIIRQFLVRLNRRLRTRRYIELVQKEIPFPPTELAYHHQFIEKLRIDLLTSDEYETFILRELLRESQQIIQAEKDYRPDGTGYLEVKEDFEDLVFLTTPLTTKRSVSARGCWEEES